MGTVNGNGDRPVMRVGIVTEYYRPWPGGISEHVHHEAIELRRLGHEAFILTGAAPPGWQDEDRSVLRLGLEVRYQSNGSLSRVVLGWQVLALRSIFRRLRLDVVHVHAPLDPLLGLAAVAASEVATVGTFHASFRPSLLWHLLYGVIRPVTGRAFRRLDVRIAVSEEAYWSIARFFPESYEIVPNGVDTDRFHPSVHALNTPNPEHPTILWVGRPDPRKGLPLLLAAFRQVRERVPGAQLVLVTGSADAAERVRRMPPGELGADTQIEGYVPPEQLPGYYASCDVFCSPATGQESQGIVLLEAMASGRPVVSFAIPGYREVIEHGREGCLVPRVEAEPLGDALIRLLLDEPLRRRMGEEARRTAQRYAWPAIGQRLEALFLGAHTSRLAAAAPELSS